MSAVIASAQKRYRVLVVDDQDALRRALIRSLRSAGFEAIPAEDGRAAVEIFKTSSFDAVVSDISMPKMNGIELLRAVREHDLDVPVILMTGAPDIHTAAQAVEYGALQYLIKPIDLTELEKSVSRATKLYRIACVKREALVLTNGSAVESDTVGLEAGFAKALNGLWMAFQPIVSAKDGTLSGYEALMRSTDRTLPHPGAVLDAAERLNRLTELGRAIRASVASAIEKNPCQAMVYVNLHAQDLLDEGLFSAGSPLSAIASRVVLEVTERASLASIKDLSARMADLRRMGFRIAVDDLGAGYAGLTSFASLEPEIVKLDMSLVRDVDTNLTKQKLIRSMTALCHDMNMLVVAEGVETLRERDAVVDLGCDLLQGYLLAKPGPPFPTVNWSPT